MAGSSEPTAGYAGDELSLAEQPEPNSPPGQASRFKISAPLTDSRAIGKGAERSPRLQSAKCSLSGTTVVAQCDAAQHH